MKKIIAVIGSSVGQSGLFRSAKEMGLEVISFSIPGLTDYSHLSDRHYLISVTEIDKIVEICKEENVVGVVSNGSDFTARIANQIAFDLGLKCNDPLKFDLARNKNFVRKITNDIEELSPVNYTEYKEGILPNFPCIVKPYVSGGKCGLSIAYDQESFANAIHYAKESGTDKILLEDYIDGLELSVETLSYNGQHYVIQTCEADTTGAPHFVEIAHHLPANVPHKVEKKIRRIVPRLLNAIGFENGATDIELKVDSDGNVYLIEINLRGAGGNITNYLVPLSTGYDYLRGLIEIAIDEFQPVNDLKNDFVGDYYLCLQTEYLLPLFRNSQDKEWLVMSTITPTNYTRIKEIKTNEDREGFIIYKGTHKITLEDLSIG
ncbi:MAG: ATP-grasp domain-containing protein [Bacteroides sp.]|nr:ATP-grasp domain-containing protein [Bacteroides sp.]